MREILFRGKRVDNGEWVYGYYWFIESHRDEKLSGKHFIKSINNGIDYEVIPETVGQFTGLTDKNGTKIFEGDIVTNFANVFKSVVQWNNVGFAPFSNDKTSFFADECEVIGNIHERENDE